MTQTTISMILMRKKMMNKLIAVLALAILLVACTKQATPEQAAVAPIAVVTPASDLPDISGDIAGVDALDQDLSTDDLNNVESDIDQVNW